MIPRSKPLPRKRAKARKWKSPRCIGIVGTSTRCHKPQEQIGRCVPHAKKYLDGLFTDVVVTGRCEIDHDLLGIRCSGDAETLHGLDRDELGVRWDVRNGFSGCSGANKWGHVHKRRWYVYVEKVRGAAVYADLTRRADAVSSGSVKVDYEEIERELRAALAARREAAA